MPPRPTTPVCTGPGSLPNWSARNATPFAAPAAAGSSDSPIDAAEFSMAAVAFFTSVAAEPPDRLKSSTASPAFANM